MIYPEYDSPLVANTINDVAETIGKQIDEMCVRALHRIAIDVDEKTLVKALAQDSSRYREAYNKGYETRDTEIVRCKDCEHRPKREHEGDTGFRLEFPDYKCPCQCEDGWYSWYPDDDWFCAYGERREDDNGKTLL